MMKGKQKAGIYFLQIENLESWLQIKVVVVYVWWRPIPHLQ